MINGFAGAICTEADPCEGLAGVVVTVIVVLFVGYMLLVTGTLFVYYKFRKRKNHPILATILMYLWLAAVAVPAVLVVGSALID